MTHIPDSVLPLLPPAKRSEMEQIYRRAARRAIEREALKAKLEELGVNIPEPDAAQSRR